MTPAAEVFPAAARVDVLLTADERRAGLEADVRSGLTATVKQLAPKYFYDARGSRLFDRITGLPEYYPTRTEHAILARHAPAIAQAANAQVLLELGSGSSAKTRILLDALARTGRLDGYVPVDVSGSALRTAIAGLRRDYPELAVHGAVADFDRHLDRLPAPGLRLIAFLGSTIGNYPPQQRQRFLDKTAAAMRPGETLLLGLDLVKDPERLVAAYDDSAGVTAQFNRNVLHVLNQELGADFDPDRFAHVARWDPEREWIDIRLRADCQMTVHLTALDLEITLAPHEEIRTEISAKFRQPRVETELTRAGLELEQWWTDPARDDALALARR